MAKRKQRPSRSNRDNLLASIAVMDDLIQFRNDGDPTLRYLTENEKVRGKMLGIDGAGLGIRGDAYAYPLQGEKGELKTIRSRRGTPNRIDLLNQLFDKSKGRKGSKYRIMQNESDFSKYE